MAGSVVDRGAVWWMAGWLLLGLGCTPPPAPPPTDPPKVRVTHPVSQQVTDYLEYTGRIEPNQTVEIRPRVTGYLDRVTFTEGDFVNEGDLLFEIDPRTYQAANDQAVARIGVWEAKLKFANSVLKRNEQLVKSGAVTQEEFEGSLASRDESAASLVSAQADAKSAELNLGFTKIFAPISGRIDRAFVTKGNLVHDGAAATLLTTLVSTEPAFVYFDVDELALLRILQQHRDNGEDGAKPVRERKIPARIILANGQEHPEEGVLDFSANRLDSSTGTIRVRAVYQNANRVLIPGAFVRVRVQTEPPHSALLIPERSIGTDLNTKFVYVVDEAGQAQRREIVLGTRQDPMRVVRSGLAPGDRIISSSIQRIRPGEKVVAVEEPSPQVPAVPPSAPPIEAPASPEPAPAPTERPAS